MSDDIDWNRLGISYDNNNNNNEESDDSRHEYRNDFNDNHNRHNFNGGSDSALSSFEQQKQPQNGRQHEWSDSDNNGNKLWPKRGQNPISLAIKSRRTLKLIPHNEEMQELEPQIIEITSKPIPLALHFKTHSSQLTVHQSMHSNPVDRVEEILTHEKPYRMRHQVMKPIIQEVNEIIQPYRHFVQHINPLIENIKTIVSEKSHHMHGRHPNPDHHNMGHMTPNHMTPNRPHHSHNSFDNNFNNAFGHHFEQNHNSQNYNNHQNHQNSGHFEPKSENFRINPTQDMGRDFSASNPLKTYRIFPIVLKRSDISGQSANTGPTLPPQLLHALRYLNAI